MSVEELKSVWNHLGSTDPLWAVLTDPAARNGRWDHDAFFQIGERDIDTVTGQLRERGLSFGNRVLDFGCGVGRLSNALALHVGSVVGVDLSDSMVAEAKRLNRRGEKLTFVSYDGRVLPFQDGEFDGALSLIVLQHAPPAVQLQNLLELQRVIRRGGLLVFQAPHGVRPPTPLPDDALRARIEVVQAPARLRPGARAFVTAQVTNQSAHPWPVGQSLKLGNHWGVGAFYLHDDGRVELPRAIAPGESVSLKLPVCAPKQPGRATLTLDMVQEFVCWWADRGGATTSCEIDLDEGATSSDGQPGGTSSSGEADEAPPPGMEMHLFPSPVIEAVLGHCGSTLLAKIPDVLAGPEWESFTYVVRVGV